MSTELLSTETRERLTRVPEFEYIQEIANDLGVKVWLFGGSAAAFGHYVRWDLEREAGDQKYQPERFDYDFTNIYRGNQDLDIVVDGGSKKVQELHSRLIEKYPHFIGSKDAWEVRSLKKNIGDKQALLNNPDFLNQHTDSNSIGMISLNSSADEIVYRDLFDWKNKDSLFLNDIAQARVKYFFNKKHKTTLRYKEDKNPPVLSAIRFLAKVAQYEVEMDQKDFAIIKKIVAKEDWDDLSGYSEHKLKDFALKTLLNSPDSEYAWNLLEESGFRKKLIEMDDSTLNKEGSLSWWLNKEPLRSQELGQKGESAADIARELGEKDLIVSHETNSFPAYENITRSARGEANAFISRQGVEGEAAAFGEGFYTQIGQKGAKGTGLTIRFKVHPDAREGEDFERFQDFIVIKNKKALTLIQENINLSALDFLKLLDLGEITKHDKGLIEKFKRKFERGQDLEPLLDYIKESIFIAEDFPLRPKIPQIEDFSDLISFYMGRSEAYRTLIPVLDQNGDLRVRPDWMSTIIKKGLFSKHMIDEFFGEKSDGYWFNHPQMENFIDDFIELGSADWPIVSTFLATEKWENHPKADEWLFKILERGEADNGIIVDLLVREKWANHPRAVEVLKTLIRRGNSMIAKDIFNQPFWQEKSEFPELVQMHLNHIHVPRFFAEFLIDFSEWSVQQPQAPEFLALIIDQAYQFENSKIPDRIFASDWTSYPLFREYMKPYIEEAKDIPKSYHLTLSFKEWYEARKKGINLHSGEELSCHSILENSQSQDQSESSYSEF